MSDSGQGDGQRSWWEKPDQEPPAQDPYGSTAAQSSGADVHDPYRSTPPADAPTQAHPTSPPAPTESLPQYGQQSSPYAHQYGQPSGQQQSGQYGQYGQYGPPSGYAQQYPQNQQYPGQYGGQQVPVAGMAHAVLWTAVGGLALMFTGVGWIAAIVALALTPGARREITESNGAKRGLGFLLAGKICAWVNIGLTVLVVIGLVVVFGIIGANGGFDDSSSSFDSNSVSVLFTH
jgi:hypothetical protein